MKNASMSQHPLVSMLMLMFLAFGVLGILLTSLFLVGCIVSGEEDASEAVVRPDPLPDPRPLIEAGDDDTSLVIRFTDVFQSGDWGKAYDVQWRTKTLSSWSSGCIDVTSFGGGLDAQNVTVTTTISDLEPGTKYQVRYRDTNRRHCFAGLGGNAPAPDPWSPIGEGATSRGQ